MPANTDAILLLAHGTVAHLDEMADFLTSVRRGRPPSSELVHEMIARYREIGGSPHLALTRAQAAAVAEASTLRCDVAMRLWHPRVESVLAELAEAGIQRVCLLPLAPFSVEVYVEAARAAQAAMSGPARHIELRAVTPWGSHPDFIEASYRLVQRHLPSGPTSLVVTAHSLPLRVIAAGDRYANEFESFHAAVEARLGCGSQFAYQSQGADGGQWLGPTLRGAFESIAAAGGKHVTVAPLGFLSEHVETLYDLDIEAARQAQTLGLGFTRIPTLNTDGAFVSMLTKLARQALDT